MALTTCDWHPDADEVKAILEELRPTIAECAMRDEERLALISVSAHFSRVP